jgi:hypothetical protein
MDWDYLIIDLGVELGLLEQPCNMGEYKASDRENIHKEAIHIGLSLSQFHLFFEV